MASYVRDLITSGTVRPGEFLRMEPIAEAMGVSNTPVREGLFSLRSEGLVTLVPRRGFQVVEFTPQDIRDLFWTLATLAGELAARATEKIAPEEIDHLDRLLRRHEALTADADTKDADTTDIASLSHEFHRTINHAAESPRLARLLGSMTKQVPLGFYTQVEEQATTTRHEHARIADALRSRDPQRARTEMESHLLDGADRVIDVLRQRGVWDGPVASA